MRRKLLFFFSRVFFSSDQSSSSEAASSEWFYKCPYCEAKFHDPNKKSTSVDSLACHIVNKHRLTQVRISILFLSGLISFKLRSTYSPVMKSQTRFNKTNNIACPSWRSICVCPPPLVGKHSRIYLIQTSLEIQYLLYLQTGLDMW